MNPLLQFTLQFGNYVYALGKFIYTYPAPFIAGIGLLIFIFAMNLFLSKEEPRTYQCPRCGYRQTFDEAYADSGHYCPNCDAPLDIPLSYWVT